MQCNLLKFIAQEIHCYSLLAIIDYHEIMGVLNPTEVWYIGDRKTEL